MPRRIVSIRRRAEVRGLRSEWVEFLFRGHLIAEQLAFLEPSEAEARAMWAAHGGQLLRWWLDGIPADAFRSVHFGFVGCEKANPAGTRPWAWWRFDAPERRRLIAVGELIGPSLQTRIVERAPIAEDEVQAWSVGKNWFGEPSPTCGGIFRFETEAAFLMRHGLLTKAEQEAIANEG